MKTTYKISIQGTVQGVGFRPFVYSLAHRYALTGTISNGAKGVEIIINASEDIIKVFIASITQELPPLAKIDSLDISAIEYKEFEDFRIIDSQKDGDISVHIPPDVSICSECEAELFDKNNRRYLYPFITCTNCGVRYSIIKSLPYDRDNTTMRFFKMCDKCHQEYTNPLDRRYHAQPIGCYECGPKMSLYDKNKILDIPQEQIIPTTIQAIKDGKIVALKGVGGYHLVCDATNYDAVQRLRDKKHRPTKPFGVMVSDITQAKNLAYINQTQEQLLLSKERPIVLLKSKPNGIVASNVAPNISKIGIFLPYTPLHLLILKSLDRVLVATSANLSDEPIATNLQSIQKLSNVYDLLLDHNREIANGCDDSVVMALNQSITIRRARGYTPVAIKLPVKLKRKVLAMGANQKSTIAIGFDEFAIISAYIGDLNSIESVKYYQDTMKNLMQMYDFKPELIVCDKHPNYESTTIAKEISLTQNIPLQTIQHHYAHALSVMAQKQLSQDVFAVVFDGTGYGDDGELWGGEFMVCNLLDYKRVGHLKYFKLLGASKAIKEPRRVALSLLFDIYGKDALSLDLPTIKAFTTQELNTHFIMWQKSLNSPNSSSMGRIFDAISSLVGVVQMMSFEGESGMRLEEYYDASIKSSYDFEINQGVIELDTLITQIIKEPNPKVAISKFFNTIVEIIAQMYQPYAHMPLLLSGGVFQNSILCELILQRFEDAIIPDTISVNDSAIALGQILGSNQV